MKLQVLNYARKVDQWVVTHADGRPYGVVKVFGSRAHRRLEFIPVDGQPSGYLTLRGGQQATALGGRPTFCPIARERGSGSDLQ